MNLPFDDDDYNLLAPLPDDVTNYIHPLWWSQNWNTLFVIRTDVFNAMWVLVSVTTRAGKIQHIISTYSDYTLVFATYKNGMRDMQLTRIADFVFSFGPHGLGMSEFSVIKSRGGEGLQYDPDEGPWPQQLLFLEKFNEWTAPQNVINNTYDGPNPSNRIS
jgi:hypothetical protein